MAPATMGENESEYWLGPGDVVDIDVWGHPELSTSVTVRPDGRVSIPLVEEMPVTGKTPFALARDFEASLSRYIPNPRVQIRVRAPQGAPSRQVRVIGQAATPKALPYRSGMRLLDVMAAVGGLSRYAAGDEAVIIRRRGDGTERIPVRVASLLEGGDPAANIPVEPGDILLIPQGFLAGGWTLTYGLGVMQSYTDNVDLAPSDQAESAFVTEIEPQMRVLADTARIKGGLAASALLRREFGNGGETEVSPRLALDSVTELAEDRLFAELDASIREQALSPRSASSILEGNDRNRSRVGLFHFSPYLLNRVGDFALARTQYSLDYVTVGESARDAGRLSDSLRHEGRFSLDGRPLRSRLSWGALASVAYEDRNDDGDVRELETSVRLEYLLLQSLSLIGSVGYESFESDPGSRPFIRDGEPDFSGPTWATGFRWFPNTATSLLITYGREAQDNHFTAQLTHRPGDHLVVNASYDQTIETSQSRLLDTLPDLFTEVPISPPIIGGADPIDSPLTLTDTITRTETLELGVVGTYGRNSVTLSAARVEEQSLRGDSIDDEIYQIEGGWHRRLRPHLDFRASGSYSRVYARGIDPEDIDVYTAATSLTYSLYHNASLTFSFQHRTWDSSNADNSFRENVVSVGFLTTF